MSFLSYSFQVLLKSNVGICGHHWPQTRRIVGWGQNCTGTTFEKSELFIFSFCKAPHSAFGHSLVKRSRSGRADSANLEFLAVFMVPPSGRHESDFPRLFGFYSHSSRSWLPVFYFLNRLSPGVEVVIFIPQ